MLISPTTKCAICGRIITDHSRESIAFHVGRAFHRGCLERHPVQDPSALPVWPQTRVGYFREFTKKPANPWLSESANAQPMDEEKRIIDYLRSGIVLVAASEKVLDPLDGTQQIIGNGSILTDQVWDWPDYLPTLVAKYHVRLDRAFVEHMRQHNWTLSKEDKR